MTFDDLLHHYKSTKAIADELNFSRGAPLQWFNVGYIPYRTQLLIEKRSAGLFKAELDERVYK